MKSEIEELVSYVLDDIRKIRESDMEIREQLPVEIMALNAIANAYEKALTE